MFRGLLQAYYLRQSQKRAPSALEYTSFSSCETLTAEATFFFKPNKSKHSLLKLINKLFFHSQNRQESNDPMEAYAIDTRLSNPVQTAKFGKYDMSGIHSYFKYGLTSLTVGAALFWFIFESYQGLCLF